MRTEQQIDSFFVRVTLFTVRVIVMLMLLCFAVFMTHYLWTKFQELSW